DLHTPGVGAEAPDHPTPLREGEGAPKPTEEALGLALELAKPHIAAACDMQLELVRQAGVQPREYPLFAEYEQDVAEIVRSSAEAAVREAITVAGKAEREAALDGAKQAAQEAVAAQLGEAFTGRAGEAAPASGRPTTGGG